MVIGWTTGFTLVPAKVPGTIKSQARKKNHSSNVYRHLLTRSSGGYSAALSRMLGVSNSCPPPPLERKLLWASFTGFDSWEHKQCAMQGRIIHEWMPCDNRAQQISQKINDFHLLNLAA